MSSRDPTGHGTRFFLRIVTLAAIAVFALLTTYFIMHGPFHEEEPANPAAGGDPEVIERAAPPKQPDTP